MHDITFISVAAIALAGAVGACLRLGVDRLFHRIIPSAFPTGILIVNLSGAFFVGFMTGITVSVNMDETIYQLLAVGFAGSYTTFSGWMVQTVELLDAGARREAAMNIFASIIPGWMLTLIGYWLGTMI